MPPVVDSLRATVPALIALVTGSKPDAFKRKPASGEWDAITVLAHLADAELVYGYRIRAVLADPGVAMPGYDEKVWAERFGPLEDDPARLLARFRIVRESLIALVESLADDEWERVGLHEEAGEMTIRALIDRVIAHDRAHLDQIRVALDSP